MSPEGTIVPGELKLFFCNFYLDDIRKTWKWVIFLLQFYFVIMEGNRKIFEFVIKHENLNCQSFRISIPVFFTDGSPIMGVF